MAEFKFDEIGYWSEVKLSIIKEYAGAYSTILNGSNMGKLRGRHAYIDGFAGCGMHLTKGSKEFVPGSPLNALLVEPPFSEYHLIDLNAGKASNLKSLTADKPNVTVYTGDCNQILAEQVLPKFKYEDFRRALCILDPYGLHLDWNVIQMAGQLKTVDLFLNFPVMDMNMNVLWRNPAGVDQCQAARLTRYWGDESWKQAAYVQQENLFGFDEVKLDNNAVAKAFKKRLKDVAGFENVLDPIPMRNDQGGIVYYLYFASQSATGNKIAKQIFEKYRNRGSKNG